MKKLKLSELNLGNAEVLSREELKKVLGGMGSGGTGSGDGSGSCFLRCDQGSQDGVNVTDCSRSTAKENCTDVSNAVCIC